MAHLPGASADSGTRFSDPNDTNPIAKDPRSPSDGQTTAGIAAPTAIRSLDSDHSMDPTAMPHNISMNPTPSTGSSRRRKAQSWLGLNMEEDDPDKEPDDGISCILETIEKVFRHPTLPKTAANRAAEHTVDTAGPSSQAPEQNEHPGNGNDSIQDSCDMGAGSGVDSMRINPPNRLGRTFLKAAIDGEIGWADDEIDEDDGDQHVTVDSGVDVAMDMQLMQDQDVDPASNPPPQLVSQTSRAAASSKKRPRHPASATHVHEIRTRPVFVIELPKRRTTPDDESGVAGVNVPEREDKQRHPKRRRKGTPKGHVIPVSELEPNIELAPKERLVTIEVPNDDVDEIVSLMGTGQWTSEGSDWMASTRGARQDSRDLYLPSARDTARRLRRLIGVCDRLSELHDPAARLRGVGYLETAGKATVVGQLLELQNQLPEIAADGAQPKERYEDLSRHVIPLAVVLLRSLLHSGTQNPPSDPRVFHTMPTIQALTCVVDMILELDDLVRLDAAACDTEEMGQTQSDPYTLSYTCSKLMNGLVTARNDVVLCVNQARYDAKARERARARQAAKEAAIEEQTQRTTTFQASAHAFLSQEGSDSGYEPVGARPRAHMTSSDKYLKVMEELRGSGHPDLEQMARSLGCSVDDIWEMIGGIKEEAERAYEEDGIAIPRDLFTAFSALYE